MTFIGFVGTSRQGIVSDDSMDECLRDVKTWMGGLSEYPLCFPVVIVSGGGQIARRALRAEMFGSMNNVTYLQLTNSKVNQTLAKRIDVGKQHGSESQALINLCDVLVRIGGGPQSHHEVKMFKQLKPDNPVLEYDPPTHQPCK